MRTTQATMPFTHLLGHLSAGSFEQQINKDLATIARQVVATGERGAMVIKLRFKLIGESQQVTMTHSLRSIIPQLQGRVIEETASKTPLLVGRDGQLQLHQPTGFND